MQNFVDIPSTESLTNSRQELLNNDRTIMSCSSGASFPTTNLEQGMFCYRTDLFQLFQLKDLTPTWIMVFDLTQVATNQAYVDAVAAALVPNSSVATTATANKLLKLDANGKLPASITGNAATATTATAASSVPWSGVTGVPATFAPPVATPSILGGVKVGSGITAAGDGTISVALPAAFSFSNSSYFSGSTQGAWNPSPGSGGFLYKVTVLNQYSGAGAGTYTLQSLLQSLINLSHYHGSMTIGSGNCCSCGGCFIYGTLVRMADGTVQKIEDVKVGDYVVGLTGKPNRVTHAMDVEIKGRTSIFQIDNLVFSGTHLLWVKDEDGSEGWGSHDLNVYLNMLKYRTYDNPDGGDRLKYEGIVNGRPIPVFDQIAYAHVDGWRVQQAVCAREYPEGMTFATLMVDGDHSFIANGYVVGGGYRFDKQEYDKLKWGGLSD